VIDKLNSVILNRVKNLYTYNLLCLTGKGLKPLVKGRMRILHYNKGNAQNERGWFIVKNF